MYLEAERKLFLSEPGACPPPLCHSQDLSRFSFATVASAAHRIATVRLPGAAIFHRAPEIASIFPRFITRG